jgi:hypothetical protein
MQLVSFIAMVVIFFAVVTCPSGDEVQDGICQYRDEMTLGGAGMMLALLGVRYGQKTDKKKKMKGQMS